jgi:predicted metal-dependent phosphoesterase TrpH
LGRWDLHFHTPTSFDYKNRSVTNEQIVEGLKKAGVNVVAITDHHVIDAPRIRALQKLAGNDLTVLPGIGGQRSNQLNYVPNRGINNLR